ncbi:unnamed protein product [Ceutorhynchus assimilis]|uniref:Uncharacterized protein n=1 Tax=Ceutorhynchus assimilis TaxID=467358 RepID=A0A9N9MCR5_9CUCU|nr:unnamed protein product [Ceutorhynchus assimilis]
MNRLNRPEGNPNPENFGFHTLPGAGPRVGPSGEPSGNHPTYYQDATFGFGPLFPPLMPQNSPSAVQYQCFNPSSIQSPLPPEGYNLSQITQLDEELLDSEDFLKFLDHGCVIAEQIAYRHRNRSFFRKLLTVCAKTRSTIRKPNKTIPNINSKGIPWATRDSIHAFMHLVDTWKLMRGYWDNREVFSGCHLGIIRTMLNPEFRSCYLQWEKLTKEMTGHLMNMFYNLDQNFNAPSSSTELYNTPSPASLVNLTSSSSEETVINQLPFTDSSISTQTNSPIITPRGIIHLPVASVKETGNPANQTVSDSDKKENCNRRYISGNNYFPPGDYNVPKTGCIAQRIEGVDTDENLRKAQDAWANFQLELNLSTTTENNLENILSDYTDGKNPRVQQERKSLDLPVRDLHGRQSSTTLLGVCNPRGSRGGNPYELPGVGITETGLEYILKYLINRLMLVVGRNETEDLYGIIRKLLNEEYSHVNEVVRDLKYLTKVWDKSAVPPNNWTFEQKLQSLLITHFFAYDFDHIEGYPNEQVGALKFV